MDIDYLLKSESTTTATDEVSSMKSAALSIGCAALLSSILITAPACAADAVGLVVAVQGNVQILRDGTSLQAKLKEPVYAQDTIRTAADGRIKLFFEQTESMATIAGNSEVRISEFHYKGEGRIWRALFYLGSGRIRLDIDKVFGKDFSVMTPSAIAGAKGTSFILSYVPAEDLSTLVVLTGTVSFESKAAKLLVGADQWSTIRGALAPTAPAELPDEVRAREVFEMRSQSSRPAGSILPESSRFKPQARPESQEEVVRSEKVSVNPQVQVMEPSAAFIRPGSLTVDTGAPQPPPVPPQPQPPKPKPQPARPGGGSGGPF
jgi:hypothetical protein